MSEVNKISKAGQTDMDIEGRIKGKGQVERIDPESAPPGIVAIHKVRYEFAKGFCAGKKVLDLACGAGYGSAILADVAESVIGADIDNGALQYALRSYRKRNLSFVMADAEKTAFETGQFDTVVSFETIEHLGNIEAYLSEVKRILSPQGHFVVSTPRVRRTTRRPGNPHHTIEFSAKDLEGLLRRYFSHIDLYGQIRVQSELHYWIQKLDVLRLRRFLPVGLRRGVDRHLGTVPFEEMDTAEQRIVMSDLRRASDMIAVCKGVR